MPSSNQSPKCECIGKSISVIITRQNMRPRELPVKEGESKKHREHREHRAPHPHPHMTHLIFSSHRLGPTSLDSRSHKIVCSLSVGLVNDLSLSLLHIILGKRANLIRFFFRSYTEENCVTLLRHLLV